MATTVELRDEVLAHQFSSTRYSTLIVEWLDEAQKYIYREVELRGSYSTHAFSTVAGTENYALPADFDRFSRILFPEKNDTLIELTIEEYDRSDRTGGGEPSHYVIIGGDIFIYPTPTSAYDLELRYWAQPATMTTSVDPSLPEDFHRLLVDYALYKAYGAEHDFQAANWHWQEFESKLYTMQGQAQYDTHESPDRIRGSWSEIY